MPKLVLILKFLWFINYEFLSNKSYKVKPNRGA